MQASYDHYVSLLAQAGTEATCSCGAGVFAEAIADVSVWTDVWTRIYASLDDMACVSGTSALRQLLFCT